MLRVDTKTTARNWRTCFTARTLRFLSSKYPRLTKQSITEFKKAYNEGKRKGADLSEGIVMKSKGRPTLLPKTLTKKTIDSISALRLRGAPVTSSVINNVAKGIVQANDRTLLVENGGHLSLLNDWTRKVLYRMDTLGRKMTRCIATTTRIPVAPALLAETKLDFQCKIHQLQSWHSIPDDLIIKGCVRYIFTSLFCMSKKEYLRNKEKCFSFHFESSSRS